MIYTFTTKQEQLRNGFYRTGSGPVKVLVLGSCRAMPYLNYLDRANADNGMAIFYINPFDWHWNARDELVNLEEAIDALESDRRVLDVIQSADVFIHEHYGNYGMFNTSHEAAKNIYQFGMRAKNDISVPNFHDHFILRDDFAASGEVPADWVERGEAAVEKFCSLCQLSSFPEMAEHFRNNWRKTRFFWTPNHIGAAFSLFIFLQMNERFLRLSLAPDFWERVRDEDMFRDPHTTCTAQDIAAYGLTWNTL